MANLLKDIPRFLIYHPNWDTRECERGHDESFFQGNKCQPRLPRETSM